MKNKQFDIVSLKFEELYTIITKINKLTPDINFDNKLDSLLNDYDNFNSEIISVFNLIDPDYYADYLNFDEETKRLKLLPSIYRHFRKYIWDKNNNGPSKKLDRIKKYIIKTY